MHARKIVLVEKQWRGEIALAKLVISPANLPLFSDFVTCARSDLIHVPVGLRILPINRIDPERSSLISKKNGLLTTKLKLG